MSGFLIQSFFQGCKPITLNNHTIICIITAAVDPKKHLTTCTALLSANLSFFHLSEAVSQPTSLTIVSEFI